MFKTIKCITGRPNLGWITLNNHFPRLGMLMVVHYPMVKPLIKHGGIHLSDIKGIYLDITDKTSISKKDVDIVQSSLWLLCHVFFGQKRFGAKMVKPSGVRNGKNGWNKFLVFHIYIYTVHDMIVSYCIVVWSNLWKCPKQRYEGKRNSSAGTAGTLRESNSLRLKMAMEVIGESFESW